MPTTKPYHVPMGEKFVHAADLHLFSQLSSLDFQAAKQKRNSLLNTFDRLCAYARANHVRAVLLSGDVFDSDRPSSSQRFAFLSIIRKYPEIPFLYLKGNHDRYSDMENRTPENLLGFASSWKKYSFGDVDVYGAEFTDSNCQKLHDSLSTDPKKTNIAMLHGTLSYEFGKDKIVLSALKGKGIDYLALGHIHKHEEGPIDDRGTYVYPGCLEGRGYDEVGKKGFELREVENGLLSHRFVPFAESEVDLIGFDVGQYKGDEEIVSAILKEVNFKEGNIYRIVLKGEVSPDALPHIEDIENGITSSFSYGKAPLLLQVKDETRLLLDYQALENSNSLEGEFIRTLRGEKLPPEQEEAILRLGINALRGEDPEEGL